MALKISGIRSWMFIPPVVLGIVIFVVLVRSGSTPKQVPPEERASLVRILDVPVLDVVPRAIGYGHVAPASVWNATAEVSGRVVEKHPRLRNGNIIQAGTLVLRIDPTEYELAIARTQADIQATEAQLEEIGVRDENTRVLLETERESRALLEKEVQRKRELLKKNTVSRSDFEREQRNLLAQKQQVLTLENTLRQLPVERKTLEAQMARYQAVLESAALDLEHTQVVLPFNARIAEVDVETSQFVRVGEPLVSADAIDRAEVSAQIPIGRMRGLVLAEGTVDILDPGGAFLGESLGLSARVWLRGDEYAASWDGRVARLSDTVDPETRTVGVIVEVDDPYAGVRPGFQPPLVKGMFVEVELLGRARPGRLVIPRSALHGNEVYVVDETSRLRRRPVTVGMRAAEYAVVSEGLSAGDPVVVSDPVPAIDGMLLRTVPDVELGERLAREASAVGPTP
ncbi:MAG: efflux RND transporter periplasmic adaptor subunit [Pseudomonadota bacterium]|nr:efflux RND transporter periplasmic adaptor subunit [Pseudomonadota bacterium]